MVTNVTSLTGNGLRDWLIQRASAVILLIYALFLLGYFVAHPKVDYVSWQVLFHCRCVQVITILAIAAILAHAWIGIWTVLTDYVKPTHIRVVLEVIVILLLFAYLLWGAAIVWSI